MREKKFKIGQLVNVYIMVNGDRTKLLGVVIKSLSCINSSFSEGWWWWKVYVPLWKQTFSLRTCDIKSLEESSK